MKLKIGKKHPQEQAIRDIDGQPEETRAPQAQPSEEEIVEELVKKFERKPDAKPMSKLNAMLAAAKSAKENKGGEDVPKETDQALVPISQRDDQAYEPEPEVLIAEEIPDHSGLSGLEAALAQATDQPDDMEIDAVEAFKRAIADLADQVEVNGLIAEACRTVMRMLVEDPELEKIMENEDIGLMVRALRQSYGTKIARKTEKREKKNKKAQMGDEMMSDLANMGLDFG